MITYNIHQTQKGDYLVKAHTDRQVARVGTEAEARTWVATKMEQNKARPDDTKRAGSKPNTSIILTDDELAFIDRRYGGSKSAAIHEGLRRLMETEIESQKGV